MNAKRPARRDPAGRFLVFSLVSFGLFFVIQRQSGLQSSNKLTENTVNPWMGREFPMSINVSAVTGISRVTRPVSSDTQIGVLQRRLETLDKQRAIAASSTDETATYRLQALTQQMGLLQTQIGQLQQAAASAAVQQNITEPVDDESEQPPPDDNTVSERPPQEPSQPLPSAQAARAPEPPAGQASLVDTGQDEASAQRDAAAVARARADGSLVGSNVDTYV